MRVYRTDWTRHPGAKYLPKSRYGCITPGNTTIRTEDGWTTVRLHRTDIVSFNDDTILLNTGGWFTVTTKARMNQVAERFCLNFRVYSEDGEWVVCHNPECGGHVFQPGCMVYTFDREGVNIDRNEYV